MKWSSIRTPLPYVHRVYQGTRRSYCEIYLPIHLTLLGSRDWTRHAGKRLIAETLEGSISVVLAQV